MVMMTSGSSSMTKAERVRAALAGEAVDRVPFSLWHHFPEKDATVDGLVNETVAFYEQFDVDLIKLMPTGMYSTLPYGTTIEVVPGDSGTTGMKTSPIQTSKDWTTLSAASLTEGALAEQIEVVKRIRSAVGPDVPVIQTIFSPLSMADKMSGGALLEHLESDEDSVHVALELFAQDVIAFGRECLEAGANGFFFATQQASRDAGLSDELFNRAGVAYDVRVLEALHGDDRNWCTLLHLHGTNPRFEIADQYPIHAVNWHDRESGPPIKEAVNLTSRALVAGIDRIGPVARGDVEGAIAEVDDAIAQANGTRLIVAPSCVLPYSVDASVLRAIREHVQGLANS
jgi:uroporphyrinogen decarboxylase